MTDIVKNAIENIDPESDQNIKEMTDPIEAYQPLFEHMRHEHGLILLEAEMDEIIILSKAMLEKSIKKDPDCNCDKVEGYCCNIICPNFYPQ